MNSDDNHDLYNLKNARAEDQRREMRRLEAAGICLFCLRDGDQVGRWSVRQNEYPYPNTSTHLLLYPEDHVSDLIDLLPETRSEFWSALDWARETYRFDHWSIVSRNGSSTLTGGTIYHVHVHVIVGDPDLPPVRVRVS